MCNNEKSKKHNLKIYKIIRENGGWANWSMLLIEKFPCKDKYQACKRERELYEELDAKMNMVIPYLTQEETKQNRKQYKKQYREEHKEEIKQHFKQYYQEHKAEINEKKKEKIECKYCAKLISKSHMFCHIKICKSKE